MPKKTGWSHQGKYMSSMKVLLNCCFDMEWFHLRIILSEIRSKKFPKSRKWENYQFDFRRSSGWVRFLLVQNFCLLIFWWTQFKILWILDDLWGSRLRLTRSCPQGEMFVRFYRTFYRIFMQQLQVHFVCFCLSPHVVHHPQFFRISFFWLGPEPNVWELIP